MESKRTIESIFFEQDVKKLLEEKEILNQRIEQCEAKLETNRK